MAIESGRLFDLITLEVKTFTTNAQGQQVGTWLFAYREWAEATRVTEQNARFLMRYRPELPRPDTHRVIYWDAVWTITNAVPDNRRTTIAIDSDFTALIEATHLEATRREYIDGLAIVRPPST